jgi:hypothetical protein
MRTDKKKQTLLICLHLCSAVFPILLVGCAKPNEANIALRKENQSLREQLEQVQRERDADQATIVALKSNATTVPVLPEDRVEHLFTVHGIRLNRLTGGTDLDPKSPGDEALKIYVEPFDQDGQALKAAGSFVVEAYDLAAPADENLVGRWKFDPEQARRAWHGHAMLYEYVLTAPFVRSPAHSELTVKVTFIDELTRRQFDAQKVVHVKISTNSSS